MKGIATMTFFHIQTKTMDKNNRLSKREHMKTKIVIAVIAILFSLGIQADEVDQSRVTTFAAGTPAVAAEVNENIQALISSIDDNAGRITGLEVTAPPSDGVSDIVINCDTDAGALNAAITSASRSIALNISVSGSCAPVLIENRDNVSISGNPTATIGTDGSNSNPLTIVNAGGIVLNDLILTGGLAESAMLVGKHSSVTATNIQASGSTNSTVFVNLHSLLLMEGINSIVAGSNSIALKVESNATVVAESGATTITSSNEVLWMNGNSGMVGKNMTLTGGEVKLFGASNLLFQGIMTVGSTDVNFSSSFAVVLEQSEIATLNTNFGIYGSSLILNTEKGGTIRHTGNINATGHVVAIGPRGPIGGPGDPNTIFLGLGETVSDTDGNPISPSIRVYRNAEMFTLSATVEAAVVKAETGGVLYWVYETTVATDTHFRIDYSGMLYAVTRYSSPPAAEQVTCGSSGYNMGYAFVNTYIDYCASP